MLLRCAYEVSDKQFVYADHVYSQFVFTISLFGTYVQVGPPQCCYYISIFANICYLIKWIHSIIIILRVFMFYKQRVLANFWGYCAVHMKWAINSLFMPTTYTLNLFSLFHYLALMYKSDPPQCCYYISIFANIWYLIKLSHSIIIILRVYMFYKQRVLANFWGRKDSANCASRKRRGACYCAVHMKWAINSLFMPTTYTLNLFSLFHYLALMYKSAHLNVAIISVFLPTFVTWLNEFIQL